MIPDRRLVDEGDEFERELLRSARGDAMSPTARRDLHAAMRASAMGAGVAGLFSGRLARAAPATRSTVAAAKWVAMAMLGGALITGFAAMTRGTRRTVEAPVAPAVPAVADDFVTGDLAVPFPVFSIPLGMPPAASSEPPSPPVSSTGRANSHPRGVAADAETTATDDALGTTSLAAELMLVERARASLVAGRPQETLHALAQHRAKFAHGALEEEVEVLRIEAYGVMGEAAAASALAREFLARRRPDVYTPRVQRALDGLPRPPHQPLRHPVPEPLPQTSQQRAR